MILGTLSAPAAGAVGLAYSISQDSIAVAREPKDADLWSFHGTGFTVVAPRIEKIMELDKGAVKILNWPLAVLSVVESLVSAKSDWDKFS